MKGGRLRNEKIGTELLKKDPARKRTEEGGIQLGEEKKGPKGELNLRGREEGFHDQTREKRFRGGVGEMWEALQKKKKTISRTGRPGGNEVRHWKSTFQRGGRERPEEGGA